MAVTPKLRMGSTCQEHRARQAWGRQWPLAWQPVETERESRDPLGGGGKAIGSICLPLGGECLSRPLEVGDKNCFS